MLCCMFFFFFKQKTAYEMRISDWSSDVCSSDLLATRLQEGLSMAHHAEVDFALLDVNLAGEKSLPIADVLTGRGIPFAFVTGYGRRGVEPRYATVPVVQKPFQRPENDQVLSRWRRSEEHTSEIKPLMRLSYDVLCLKKKKINILKRI